MLDFGGQKGKESRLTFSVATGAFHTHTSSDDSWGVLCWCFIVRLLTAAVKSCARWRVAALLGTGQQDSRRTGTEGHRDQPRGGTIVTTMVASLQVVMEAPFPVDHGRTTELALRPRLSWCGCKAGARWTRGVLGKGETPRRGPV